MALLAEFVDAYGGPGTVVAKPGDEAGATALPVNQDYLEVPLITPKASTSYIFEVCEVEYPSDPPPDKIGVTSIVKFLDKFRVYFNAGPSDGNFLLNWKVLA